MAEPAAQEAPEAATCDACGRTICGRQQVISKILGGKERRLCLDCLGRSLETPPDRLCELVGNYLVRRDCYRRDWRRAAVCAHDGQAPCCPSRLENALEPPNWFRPELFTPSPLDDLPDPDLEVDAEEAGCGDLMVLLMRSIRKLNPGQILRLTARDPGASADIPSWCRLTGHRLLAGPLGEEDADYTIQRKEN